MSSIRVIYHLARADFLERVRRYSFLVMLGLVVFLGYQIAIGNMSLQLGQYRGEYNSAWVGALMSLNATFFLGWFGFFLIKGAVARDRETGVGQIMATTPMTRPLYMLGKWFSNFAVLTAMVIVLALAGILIQFWTGESAQIDLMAYLSPFFYLVLPLMGLVAACAVLFEAVPFLQGGFGNIVYFFAFVIFLPLFMENLKGEYIAFEPTGIGIIEQNMGAAVRAVYPDYNGDFSLGGSGEEVVGTFVWNGVTWTTNMILARVAFIGLALLVTVLAALFFDRFDPSHHKPAKIRTKKNASDKAGAGLPLPKLESVPSSLTPLSAFSMKFSFTNVLLSELRLLLKGQRWWWYAIAGGLIIAGLANTAQTAREIVLMLAWIWPILIWSGMGNRELRHNVQQLTFSSAAPLWRQLPAAWLAGFIVTFSIGSGVALRLALTGDSAGLLAWVAGAVFIPSMALALGVWSSNSKVFEVLYISMWYLGPLNKVPALDYLGASGEGYPLIYLAVSLALVALAFIGRARQLQS